MMLHLMEGIESIGLKIMKILMLLILFFIMAMASKLLPQKNPTILEMLPMKT